MVPDGLDEDPADAHLTSAYNEFCRAAEHVVAAGHAAEFSAAWRTFDALGELIDLVQARLATDDVDVVIAEGQRIVRNDKRRELFGDS